MMKRKYDLTQNFSQGQSSQETKQQIESNSQGDEFANQQQRYTFIWLGMKVTPQTLFFIRNHHLKSFEQKVIIKSNRILYNFMLIHSTDRLPKNPKYRNIFSTNKIEKNKEYTTQNWPILEDDKQNFHMQISCKDRFTLIFSVQKFGKQGQEYHNTLDGQFHIEKGTFLEQNYNIIFFEIIFGQNGDTEACKCQITLNKDSKIFEKSIVKLALRNPDLQRASYSLFLRSNVSEKLRNHVQYIIGKVKQFFQDQPNVQSLNTSFKSNQFSSSIKYGQKQFVINTKNIFFSFKINLTDLDNSSQTLQQLQKLIKLIIKCESQENLYFDQLIDGDIYNCMLKDFTPPQVYKSNASAFHHVGNRIINPHYISTGSFRHYQSIISHMDKLMPIKKQDILNIGYPSFLLQNKMGNCYMAAALNQLLIVAPKSFDKIVPIQSQCPPNLLMNINCDGQTSCQSINRGVPTQFQTQKLNLYQRMKEYTKKLFNMVSMSNRFFSISPQIKAYDELKLQKRIQVAVLFESVMAQYYSSYFLLIGGNPLQTYMNITNTPGKLYYLTSDYNVLKDIFNQWNTNFSQDKKIKILINIIIPEIKDNKELLKGWKHRDLAQLEKHCYAFCGYYQNGKDFDPFFILSTSHFQSGRKWLKKQQSNSSQYSKELQKWIKVLGTYNISIENIVDGDQIIIQQRFLQLANATVQVCQINQQDKYFPKEMVMVDGWYNLLKFQIVKQGKYTIVFHRPNMRNGMTFKEGSYEYIEKQIQNQIRLYKYSKASIILKRIDQFNITQEYLSIYAHSNLYTATERIILKKGTYQLLVGEVINGDNQIDKLLYTKLEGSNDKSRTGVLSISGPSDGKDYKMSIQYMKSKMEMHQSANQKNNKFIFQDSQSVKYITYQASHPVNLLAFVLQCSCRNKQDPNDLLSIEISAQNKVITKQDQLKLENLLQINHYQFIFPYFFPTKIQRNDQFRIIIRIKPQIREKLSWEHYFLKITFFDNFKDKESFIKHVSQREKNKAIKNQKQEQQFKSKIEQLKNK